MNIIKKIISNINIFKEYNFGGSKYGCMQSFSLYTLNNNPIEFNVGQKYPLSLYNHNEGENLSMVGNIFLINILWSNIKPKESKFIHQICEGVSIYKDNTYKVIFLCFAFASNPVIVPITDSVFNIKEWINSTDGDISVFFFLTEFNNKRILGIRNINLTHWFASALCLELDDYKQPNLEAIHKSISTIDISDIFLRSKYKWIYSKKEEDFIYIPPDTSNVNYNSKEIV